MKRLRFINLNHLVTNFMTDSVREPNLGFVRRDLIETIACNLNYSDLPHIHYHRKNSKYHERDISRNY